MSTSEDGPVWREPSRSSPRQARPCLARMAGSTRSTRDSPAPTCSAPSSPTRAPGQRRSRRRSRQLDQLPRHGSGSSVAEPDPHPFGENLGEEFAVLRPPDRGSTDAASAPDQLYLHGNFHAVAVDRRPVVGDLGPPDHPTAAMVFGPGAAVSGGF